jgi:hypothetical protein
MTARPRVVDPHTDPEHARLEAQRLAFAPLMFQAALCLRDTGILQHLYRSRAEGATVAGCVEASGCSRYATELLLEAGFASGLCEPRDDRFVITKMGVVWLKDELTRVNADFNHHVCYRGAFHLAEALRQGLPAGLRELGPWPTVYEGLSALSGPVRSAWFAFDHYYSDGVFEACLPAVRAAVGPRQSWVLVDIGANTGRFARACLSKYLDAGVTLVDLPQQLTLAREEFAAHPDLYSRAKFVPANFKAGVGGAGGAEWALPRDADVYWMSQFLDCFSEEEIVNILRAVRAAMRPDSKVFILETFWDLQTFPAARHCVIGTSLYFACIANGNSRMYHSAVMRRLVEAAGLCVLEQSDLLGVSHTLLTCGAVP